MTSNKNQNPLWPKETGIRRQLYALFSWPESSKAAFFAGIVITITIVLAVTSFVVESLPQFRLPNKAPKIFTTIEEVSVTIFTIEYGVKLICCTAIKLNELGVSDPVPNRIPTVIRKIWNFLINPMNVIDLLAILPFYVSLGFGDSGNGFGIVRVLRVARVFRVFKLGKYSEGLQTLVKVVAKAIPSLLRLSFFIVIIVILFGSLIFEAEAGAYCCFRDDGTHFCGEELDENSGENCDYYRQDTVGSGVEITPYRSIPSGFWWVFTTITTVGYGDLTPTTIGGRMLAIVTMLVGIVVIALPITVIVGAFTSVTEEQEWKKRRKTEGLPDLFSEEYKRTLKEHQLAVVKELIQQLEDLKKDLHNDIKEMNRKRRESSKTKSKTTSKTSTRPSNNNSLCVLTLNTKSESVSDNCIRVDHSFEQLHSDDLGNFELKLDNLVEVNQDEPISNSRSSSRSDMHLSIGSTDSRRISSSAGSAGSEVSMRGYLNVPPKRVTQSSPRNAFIAAGRDSGYS